MTRSVRMPIMRRLLAHERSRHHCERELTRAAKDGDSEARAELLERYAPLVSRLGRPYLRRHPFDRTDVMQAGALGLLQALERFDPEQGTPFWAYASWWVRQAMQGLVADLSRPVSLSDRACRHLAGIKRAQGRAFQQEGRSPSARELALATGLPVDQVESLLAAERAARSLDEPMHDGESTGTLAGMIADPSGQDGFEVVDRKAAAERIRRLPGTTLAKRERTVLRARFGLGGPAQTLSEIAVTLQVSAERVRQIEAQALDKLRVAFLDPAGEKP